MSGIRNICILYCYTYLQTLLMMRQKKRRKRLLLVCMSFEREGVAEKIEKEIKMEQSLRINERYGKGNGRSNQTDLFRFYQLTCSCSLVLLYISL